MASLFNDINTDSKLAVLSTDINIDEENTEIDFERQLDLRNNAIKNVKDPIESKDAVNKEYVDITVSNAINGYDPGHEGVYYTKAETNQKIAEATAPLDTDIRDNFHAINLNRNNVTQNTNDLSNLIVDVSNNTDDITTLNTEKNTIFNVNNLNSTGEIKITGEQDESIIKAGVTGMNIETSQLVIKSPTNTNNPFILDASNGVFYLQLNPAITPGPFNTCLSVEGGIRSYGYLDMYNNVINRVANIQADNIQLTEGIITSQPTTDNSIVNKKYVDGEVSTITNQFNTTLTTNNVVMENAILFMRKTTEPASETRFFNLNGSIFLQSNDTIRMGKVAQSTVPFIFDTHNGRFTIKQYDLDDLDSDGVLTVEGHGTFKNQIDMYNTKIYNLATPENDTDATTKKYVDDSISSALGGGGGGGSNETSMTVNYTKSGDTYIYQLPTFNGYVSLNDILFRDPVETVVIYLPTGMCRQRVSWKSWTTANQFLSNRIQFGGSSSSYGVNLPSYPFFGNYELKYHESGDPVKNSWFIRRTGQVEGDFTKITGTSVL